MNKSYAGVGRKLLFAFPRVPQNLLRAMVTGKSEPKCRLEEDQERNF